jgi:hypothetical protein
MQDSTPRLFKISEGVANSITASYLGQKTAFEVFQKIRNDMSIDHAPNAIHQFLSDDISDQCHEAIMAMLRFFSSTNEREVGGWALPYVLSSYGTKLCAYAYSVSDPIMNQLTTGIIIPHGTAEAGGFVLSVTELHEKDGVVVYWLQKPGGQVWVYSENDYEMKQFDGVPSAFKEEVNKTLGRDIDLWVSDEPIANTSLAATVQDQQGRPRVDIVKSGNKLSFSVAQSLSESFKGTAIVKNDVDDKETC